MGGAARIRIWGLAAIFTLAACGGGTVAGGPEGGETVEGPEGKVVGADAGHGGTGETGPSAGACDPAACEQKCAPVGKAGGCTTAGCRCFDTGDAGGSETGSGALADAGETEGPGDSAVLDDTGIGAGEPGIPCDAANEMAVCPFGWRCVLGTCRGPECTADPECAGNPNGEICDVFGDYVCVECLADVDCVGKLHVTECDVSEKKCVGGGCRSDSHCGAGFVCDVETGACETAPECFPPCPVSQNCVDDGSGVFVCEDKPECNDDMDCLVFRPGSPLVRCENSRCKECDTDLECAKHDSTYACLDHFCEPRIPEPGCVSDQQCQQLNGPGFTCDFASGFCVPPHTGPPCLTNGQPDDWICEVALGPAWICDPATGVCSYEIIEPSAPCQPCTTDFDCAGVAPGATCSKNAVTQFAECQVPCSNNTDCAAWGLSLCSPLTSLCACSGGPP